MATTTGNSNKPRLGVAIVTRSSAHAGLADNQAELRTSTIATRLKNRACFIKLIVAAALLFQPHVLREIITARVIAFIGTSYSVLVPATGETLLKKAHHQLPGVIGGFLTVAPRHSIIEPTMRRIAVNANMTTLFVFLEAIA